MRKPERVPEPCRAADGDHREDAGGLLRFKSVLLDEMDRVINAAKLGRPASMILKNSPISDRDIILKLEEASCAGFASI